jgi:catechol 2,3-dioxygenase-like lactoylglutathione lyase family enzyme
MNISLKHIGLVSSSIELFEKFWVDLMGFDYVWESKLPLDLCKKLFDIDYCAICRKYQKDYITLEVHVFEKENKDKCNNFNINGFNHFCILVDNRDEFIEKLEKKGIEVKKYDNPKGHQNIFVKDYEGNFIEIYKKL